MKRTIQHIALIILTICMLPAICGLYSIRHLSNHNHNTNGYVELLSGHEVCECEHSDVLNCHNFHFEENCCSTQTIAANIDKTLPITKHFEVYLPVIRFNIACAITITTDSPKHLIANPYKLDCCQQQQLCVFQI
ncbi:MAG: hypothetical protein MJ069_07645 [Salinivirgaceae bacterium]|nr:hypothetical protein [Salinivirgaceae bacterium]